MSKVKDDVTKEILQDLNRLGWENTLYDDHKVVLESNAAGIHEGITIDEIGLHFNNTNALTNQELDLVYRLRNKWTDS